jgi:rod shape-determining protein MreC
LKDSRLQGILKGAPNGATTLQYIMSDEAVKPGEEVITSGGDRIFPKGLPVGKVASVAPGKDLFLNIRVTPAAQLNQVEEVLVVTKIKDRLPDTNDLGPLRASDILAERLPTVPNKAEVDAAGNAKPGTGTATPGTTPAATTIGAPGARPATGAATKSPSATTSAPKPTTGAATTNKPAATPRTTAGTTATPAKPKPSGTTAVTPGAANGTSTTAPNGVRVVDNDAPAPKRKAPPADAPAEPSNTPSTAGEPPQQ